MPRLVRDLSDFIVLCEEYRACQPALDFMRGMLSKGATFEEMLTEGALQGHTDWAYWVRLKMGEDLPVGYREALTEVATRDPGNALRLDLKVTSATPLEQQYFAERWSPSDYPAIRDKLISGERRKARRG